MFEVITVPDPILKKKAIAVDIVDDNVRAIMDGMLEVLYRDDGVGLAANQVGILKRIMVIDLQNDDDVTRIKGFYPLFIANPEIIESSDEMIEAKEACMSIPSQSVSVNRHASIKFRYVDYNNNTQELEATGWLARAVQHEIDHLDGKLLIDYLSNLKKDVVIRRLTKLKKIPA